MLFLPNRAGAFVAEVLVFSQSFLRSEKDTVDGIPVCVTFQAIAEKPKIVVRFCHIGQAKQKIVLGHVRSI